MTIKSPYNFVPLSETVVFPDWADQISHDVPFSDGESGEIELEITAESPIFVRNGSAENDDTNFSHLKEGYNKKYFIPGTSIKGSIRNVLEIISFGKMITDDRKFSWRDLSNTDKYTPRFVKDFNSEPLSKAGFIKIKDGKWFLIPAELARIEQSDIGAEYGITLLSAVEKYERYEKNRNLTQNFYIGKASLKNNFEKQCGKFKRAKIEKTNESEYEKKEGMLVFTGQIGPKNSAEEGKHGKGKKHLEFVFFNEKENENEWIEIPDEMRKNFELNHSDERNKDHHKGSLTPNKEWGFWKPRLQNGEKMPVFWLKEKNELSAFGLAMLFRLPYDKSVHDLLPKPHKTEEHDFAESIFGFIKGGELKGRVQFSHAFAKGTPQVLGTKEEVLSSPKPTFYPNYIYQSSKTLKVYENQSNLSGWKRYPIHKEIASNNNYENSNILTRFTPLAQNSVFTGKIRFHNLKKVEIGALLSALTFHKTEKCHHSIGMAKSLGYGKTTIKTTLKTSFKFLEKEYLNEFENYMETHIEEGSWLNSKQIKELFAMTSIQTTQSDSTLKYMDLQEYPKAKNNGYYLRSYSTLNNFTNTGITSFLSLEEQNNLASERKKIIEEKRINDEKNYRLKAIESQKERLTTYKSTIDENMEISTWKTNGKDKEVAKILISRIKKKKATGEFSSNYKEIAAFLEIDIEKETETTKNNNQTNEIQNMPIKEKAQLYLDNKGDFSNADFKKLKKKYKKEKELLDKIQQKMKINR